jgi:hypothetical protein
LQTSFKKNFYLGRGRGQMIQVDEKERMSKQQERSPHNLQTPDTQQTFKTNHDSLPQPSQQEAKASSLQTLPPKLKFPQQQQQQQQNVLLPTTAQQGPATPNRENPNDVHFVQQPPKISTPKLESLALDKRNFNDELMDDKVRFEDADELITTTTTSKDLIKNKTCVNGIYLLSPKTNMKFQKESSVDEFDENLGSDEERKMEKFKEFFAKSSKKFQNSTLKIYFFEFIYLFSN